MSAKLNVRAQRSSNIIGLKFDIGPHKLRKQRVLEFEAFPLFSEPVPNCFADGASWHTVRRKTMYIEGRSGRHCCSGNPISDT